MKRVFAALGVVWLAAPIASMAQTTRTDPTDLQSWIGAALTLDLPNRWEVELEYRARMVGDASTYEGSYFTIDGSRRVSDAVALLATYRLSFVDDGPFHRGGIGLDARHDVGVFRLSFRPLLQYRFAKTAEDEESSSGDRLIARTRLRVRMPVAEYARLYASTEPYFRFGADYPLDNWRNTVGVEIDWGGGRSIDLFYVYRPDYAKSYDRTFHVIGVELGFAAIVGR